MFKKSPYIDNSLESDTLYITAKDSVHIIVECERSIKQELREHFSFEIPNARFNPKVKNGVWDGIIRLYNPFNLQIYRGLLSEVLRFAEKRRYKVEFLSDDLDVIQEFNRPDAEKFLSEIKLNTSPRDYQIDYFAHAIRNSRAIAVSPTRSGKSLMIYMLMQFYGDCNCLLIVPTVHLVYQMKSDLISYGMDEKDIHTISSGSEKETKKRIVISTWQSIYKEDQGFFDRYSVVIGDEVHTFKAKCLTSIMENLKTCSYRFGFTGTLDDSLTNKMVLQGLFGKAKQFVTTKELIDDNFLSEINIRCVTLVHSPEAKKLVSKMDYQKEFEYIVTNEGRNRFIRNLAMSLEGNTLLLFQRVETQGKPLYEDLKSKKDKVHFIYGGIKAEERETIRNSVIESDGNIIVASYGTYSTGVTIPNLHNVIFASPTKSKIRNLQSIGRALGLSDDKKMATIFDISDDLSYNGKLNTTLKHFLERVKIYTKEKFPFKLYKVKLK